MANHMRTGEMGSVIRVFCHCQPADWNCSNPCSIHIRRAYPAAAAGLGRQVGKDLPAILVSLGPAGQQRACQADAPACGERPRPGPAKCSPLEGRTARTIRGRFQPSGRNLPAVLSHESLGCHPTSVTDWSSCGTEVLV